MATPDPSTIRRSSSQPQITLQNPNPNPNSKTLTLTSSSSSSTSTLSLALTEDRLLDHNRTSPYYRGLTDSRLYLRSLGFSPGSDSITSSIGSPRSTASSSSSSVLLTIQEWVPSCFSKIKKVATGPPPQYLRKDAWDPGLSQMRDGRKPLRESDLAAPAMAQPATVGVVVGKEAGDGGRREREREREYVWAFKHRPRFLKEFICNRDHADHLQEMVIKQQCGHFIFEGPPGVGKRTMILALVRDFLGSDKLKTINELRKIKLKGESITSIDVNLRISSHHVEVNLSELRGYEKNIIVSLINESHAQSGKSLHCDHSDCRAIVLHEADRISTDAQHYLCWIMEKYKGCNKIFFCCSDAAKLQPIKHICKTVKLQPPSDSKIVEVLEFIAKKECIELPHHLVEKIAKNSKHNLRQAIRSFEASWKFNRSFNEDSEILTGWEEDIANIAKSIVREQSPRQLYIIRGKLKKLIEHNVSPDFIFDTLYLELKKLLDEPFHGKLDAMYREYKMMSLALSLDKQENSGDKSNDQRKNIHYFMKIEEFTAKFMSSYKSAKEKLML